MKLNEWFERKVAEFKDDAAYQTELLLLDLTEQIIEQMEERGIKRSDLADRLGLSRPFVTRFLNGQPNLTFKTLVQVANALDLTVNVRLQPRYMLGNLVQWERLDCGVPEAEGVAEGGKKRWIAPDESAIAA